MARPFNTKTRRVPWDDSPFGVRIEIFNVPPEKGYRRSAMRVVANFVFPDGVGGRVSYDRLITSPRDLYAALEELCGYNSEYLRQNPRLPDVYKAKIRYIAEPPGQEEWLTYPVLLSSGGGDCEDLACARVAKLRQRGEHGAKPFLYHKKKLWHVMVERENGTIEDPSAVLGMYDQMDDVSGLSKEERRRLALVAGIHRALGFFDE